MAASSSAVAVDPRLHKYDVFISFRGETRNSFTSHLYSVLCQKHIKAYIDEVSLEKGDDIERALPKAIEESTISIIIFSENYASSRWCLDELVHILKCREEKHQMVLPIFYGIDPSHIRHQKEAYAAAFVGHEERFEMEKVQKWRQALRGAAGLSGWDSRGKSDSVLVQRVAKDVISKLQSIPSTSIDDLKGLFGIHRQLCEIESRLCFDSTNVRILGIWGMGGIGKTTLARVVFKRFSNRFDGACFLESVREESQRKGLVQLKKDVFSKLLGEKDLDVSNHFVNVRLSRTKALLVLDDVDNFEQLQRLVGDRDRFGPGSKIILTSRDSQVLNESIDELYEVQALDLKNEASQLFYLKAFGKKSCRPEYEEISAEVVSYTGGNPLALQVLGSYFKSLGSFGIEKWESALEKLRRTLRVDILEVLRISYDGLDDEERDIFLDIACFHKDEKRDFVEGILENKSSIVITDLVHKSLITIDQDGLIRVHDLIQEMGWEIVRQDTKKLGKHSRLWTAGDVSYVLENNIGTEAIEGIYFPWNKEDEDVHLRADVFEGMCKLRLLKFYDPCHCYLWYGKVKVHIDGDLKYLPNRLRYLHWEYYPGKSLPSNFKPNNLVELHMPCSKLEQLWDGIQKLGSLKHINLRDSKRLTKIPDLSLAPKLEFINFSYCQRLIHIPSLNLQATLDKSPHRPQWWTIETGSYNIQAERTPGCIFLCYCDLMTLPKVSGNITKLDLRGTKLKELPSSIESLENLLILDLAYCPNLKRLPKLPRNIEVLSLSGCSKLESFPMLLGMCSLIHLYLSGCSIREIPDWLGSLTLLVTLCLGENFFDGIPASIGMLYKLKKFDIRKCNNLHSLPELPLFIESVNAEDCSSLEMVSSLRSTLTLGRWLDKYDSDNDQREFSFLNCRNLSEDAINNIFREFLYKVFCTATTPPKVVHSGVQRVIGKVVVCYPAYRIPRWFHNLFLTPSMHLQEIPWMFGDQIVRSFTPFTLSQEILSMFGDQFERSSITITLPSNWYNPETFLGFVVSVVAKKRNVKEDSSIIKCELHLTTDIDRFKVHVFTYTISSDLNHVVMWYEYFDHSKAKFERYQGASLEFESNFAVKQCGVRMLYLRDADLSMAPSSSSAAADSRPPKYDVFISFRGEDTRKGFTSHLSSALTGKQIKAYIDEVSLEKGDTIARALPEAIKESKISIIIFSENYGESHWCLDELVHILKRREEKDQIVLPIFYNIDPSHIQNQKETYAAAFVKHEERFEMEKLQKWRQALKDAAAISGWDSQNKSESKILEEVVESVKRELDTINSKRSDDFKGLFGIPEHLEKIKSFLDSPTVRLVGIWGVGGIGKTTLARVVFDRFYNDFEGNYFAPNVRENALIKGLDNLKVLGKLSAVNHRLSRKRILLVLDDVENRMQFEDLVGDPYRFCPGSKIIVTSRHKLPVDVEYKVEVLDSYDACKLFYLNAFGHESCRRGFEEISDRVVEYTKGHPLALKVLGASVFYFLESIEDWVKELKNLKRIPNNEIQVSLERSYDALDDEEKGSFLDIACFFKGERRDIVVRILEDKRIAGLVRKSLITIEDDKIQMHDLMQEMGQNIVLRSTEKLGEPSWLWIARDISFVLENNKGTAAIEGISLPLIDKVVFLRPDVFEKMYKLRLLKFYDARQGVHYRRGVEVYINGDLEYLPSELRYLHWEHYPGRSLPSNFKPDNLVELHMRCSKLEQLWDGIQELGSLKHINLRDSKLLTKIPDLSQAPKLESINLCGCSKLESLPTLSGLCSLTKLDLGFSNIREIPASIGMLYKLKELGISYCNNLQSLPASIGMLYNLKKLDISKCNNLQSLPASIGMLYNLKKLNISNCKNIQSLPELPLFIESVNAEDCSSLEMVSTSRSTLKLGRWLDKYDSNNDQREFSFLNCTKLGEYAINNIFTEFLYKVFCTATTPPEVVRSVSQKVIGDLVVCFPTEEIPMWFNNQSEGSSITITLPPNWYNPKTFLGFVVSVIVAKVHDCFDLLKCELHLKTNCGESLEEAVFEYAAINEYSIHRSDHLVMWYKYFDHSKANFEKYQEASLEFRRLFKVKRCGVRMLYLKDAVEESDDGSTANFESWRTDVMDADTSDDDFQSCGSDEDYQSCGS